MKNVYDLRYENRLLFLLPDNECMAAKELLLGAYEKTAVIIYLYYTDTLPVYYSYMSQIPPEMDLYVISSRKEVLDETEKYMGGIGKKRVQYIQKENRGRDVSALLVTGKEIVKNYEYICFLHDKKEHRPEVKEDTRFWVENLWGNQIGSAAYIGNILDLFEREKELGILAPPEPVGGHFHTWYGFGWDDSYEAVLRIAEKLRLKADIRLDKPPITFGTVLWFRSRALRKLFDMEWQFSDFDDGKLDRGDYVSYAIERIFAYVAQDAGYRTGTAMRVSYAERHLGFLQYTTSLIFQEADAFFPVSRLSDLERYKRNRSRILRFARKKECVYLYGAGKMGRLCAAVLRRENIDPAGFLVSEKGKASRMDCIPIAGVEELMHMENPVVIITVYGARMQDEMAAVLERLGCHDYIRFWDWG